MILFVILLALALLFLKNSKKIIKSQFDSSLSFLLALSFAKNVLSNFLNYLDYSLKFYKSYYSFYYFYAL